jgi:hypothetical protein
MKVTKLHGRMAVVKWLYRKPRAGWRFVNLDFYQQTSGTMATVPPSNIEHAWRAFPG